jgi:hypothetical protein
MLRIEEDNLSYTTYFQRLLCHLDQKVIVKYLRIHYIFIQNICQEIFIIKLEAIKLLLFQVKRMRKEKKLFFFPIRWREPSITLIHML